MASLNELGNVPSSYFFFFFKFVKNCSTFFFKCTADCQEIHLGLSQQWEEGSITNSVSLFVIGVFGLSICSSVNFSSLHLPRNLLTVSINFPAHSLQYSLLGLSISAKAVMANLSLIPDSSSLNFLSFYLGECRQKFTNLVDLFTELHFVNFLHCPSIHSLINLLSNLSISFCLLF